MAIVSGPRFVTSGCAEMTRHLSNFVRGTADFSRRISQISTGIRVVDRTPNPDHRLSRSTALGSDCSRTGWFRAHYETDSTSIQGYLDAVFFLDFIKLKGLL